MFFKLQFCVDRSTVIGAFQTAWNYQQTVVSWVLNGKLHVVLWFLNCSLVLMDPRLCIPATWAGSMALGTFHWAQFCGFDAETVD